MSVNGVSFEVLLCGRETAHGSLGPHSTQPEQGMTSLAP